VNTRRLRRRQPWAPALRLTIVHLRGCPVRSELRVRVERVLAASNRHATVVEREKMVASSPALIVNGLAADHDPWNGSRLCRCALPTEQQIKTAIDRTLLQATPSEVTSDRNHHVFAKLWMWAGPRMDCQGMARRRQKLSAAPDEARRVLKLGAELHFLEHVRSDGRVAGRLHDLLDATVWPSLWGGEHCARRTTAAIERAGFRIEHLQRFRFPDARHPVPARAHVLGIARAA